MGEAIKHPLFYARSYSVSQKKYQRIGALIVGMKIRLVVIPVVLTAFSAVMLLVGENTQEDQSESSDPHVTVVRKSDIYTPEEYLVSDFTPALTNPTIQEKERTAIKLQFLTLNELSESLPQEERGPLPFSAEQKLTEFDNGRPALATAATENVQILAQAETADPIEEPIVEPTEEEIPPTAVPEPEPVVEEVLPDPEPVVEEPAVAEYAGTSLLDAGQAAYYDSSYDWGGWENIYWIHANAGRIAQGAYGPSPQGYHCVHVSYDVVGVTFILRANGVEITCVTADMVHVDHKGQWAGKWAIELSWTAFVALGLDSNNYVEVYSP